MRYATLATCVYQTLHVFHFIFGFCCFFSLSLSFVSFHSVSFTTQFLLFIFLYVLQPKKQQNPKNRIPMLPCCANIFVNLKCKSNGTVFLELFTNLIRNENPILFSGYSIKLYIKVILKPRQKNIHRFYGHKCCMKVNFRLF